MEQRNKWSIKNYLWIYKVSLVGSFGVAPNNQNSFTVLGGGLVGVEYLVKENLDVYGEFELGIGPKMTPKKDEKTSVDFGYVAKLSGVKYKNYKLGAFTGAW